MVAAATGQTQDDNTSNHNEVATPGKNEGSIGNKADDCEKTLEDAPALQAQTRTMRRRGTGKAWLQPTVPKADIKELTIATNRIEVAKNPALAGSQQHQ